MHKYIFGVDPSGNFKEGKGTTGFALFNSLDKCTMYTHFISAKTCGSQEQYWQEILDYVVQTHKNFPDSQVVIEDYVLYQDKALQQSYSELETARLIGALIMHCMAHKIPYSLQQASLVKKRWANHILVHKKYLDCHNKRHYIPNSKIFVNRHCIDALRHAVHYATFYNE